MLSPDEQAKFIASLDNPSSELVQKLLASEELEKARREPWWEAEDIALDFSSSAKRFGVRPESIRVPSAMVKSVPTGATLVYNLCAVLCVLLSMVNYVLTHYLSQYRLRLCDTSSCQFTSRRSSTWRW